MHTYMLLFKMKFIMYNKNGCGQGHGLSIGAWHVGAVIMVPETISKKLRPMQDVSSTNMALTWGCCVYGHPHLHSN